MKTGSADTPGSLLAAKDQYRSLVEKIGEPFALPELLRRAEKSGLQRPHATSTPFSRQGLFFRMKPDIIFGGPSGGSDPCTTPTACRYC